MAKKETIEVEGVVVESLHQLHDGKEKSDVSCDWTLSGMPAAVGSYSSLLPPM